MEVFMENIIIKKLFRNPEEFYGKEIQISGWVRTLRDQKTFGFIEMQRNLLYCQNLELGCIIVS